MRRICPHNYEIDCDHATCDSCGWNPTVAKARLEKVVKNMTDNNLYKIPFTGYCEVWADSPEEALDKADDGQMFFVEYDFGEAECLIKEDSNEMD
jgi:hypothetical protein